MSGSDHLMWQYTEKATDIAHPGRHYKKRRERGMVRNYIADLQETY
jgi:hypothetical protein